jgi:hypothetical protein
MHELFNSNYQEQAAENRMLIFDLVQAFGWRSPSISRDTEQAVRTLVGRPLGEATFDIFEWEIEMKWNMSVALYVIVLGAVVVGVDLLFFRNRFWERLMANIGIVLVFAAFYLRFLKNP